MKSQQKMTIKDKLNMLSKKYWDYKDISQYCEISISVATKLKRQVIEKYPNAQNKYNSRWVNNENVILEFFQETKEKHIVNLLSTMKMMSELGANNYDGQIG